eukprot:TRINITY_DN9849_c0_g1_i1.p1 TRINITY_DN9849_c0_g1~~TRINITY_DN9849_c0_g1_i1.p1  ORF type:complete len:212 (-),score=39.07 TRINITY_DN9849_c0_g1_i1:30-665(-)
MTLEIEDALEINTLVCPRVDILLTLPFANLPVTQKLSVFVDSGHYLSEESIDELTDLVKEGLVIMLPYSYLQDPKYSNSFGLIKGDDLEYIGNVEGIAHTGSNKAWAYKDPVVVKCECTSRESVASLELFEKEGWEIGNVSRGLGVRLRLLPAKVDELALMDAKLEGLQSRVSALEGENQRLNQRLSKLEGSMKRKSKDAGSNLSGKRRKF